MKGLSLGRVSRACLLAATILAGFAPAIAHADDSTADNNGQFPLPTGQYVTPTMITGAKLQFLNPGLANYPDYVAGIASRSAVSPDGNTLLIATNGFNRQVNLAGTAQLGFTDPGGTQYVFVYDIGGANKAIALLKQVLLVPQIYEGLIWAGNTSFYVSGGYADNVLRYDRASASAGFGANPAVTIPLGHARGLGGCIQGCQSPNAAGLAITADRARIVIANMFNDSISIISTATNTVTTEYDLRPYHTQGKDGVAGGEQPYDVAIAGNTVFVSSVRDRQIVVLDISGAAPAYVKTIALKGAPNHMALSPSQDRLYAAEDVQDYVAVIDTAAMTLLEEIDARAPAGVITTASRYTGASPSSVTVSPDGKTLFVTNGGSNAVAIIPVSGPAPHAVAALVPTGWFPQSVALSADGNQMYIVNGKSDQGANPKYLFGPLDTTRLTTVKYPGGNLAAAEAAAAANQYQLQLHRSALVSAPVPAATDYAALTNQVAANNFYSAPPVQSDLDTMAALRGKIQHIIYIVKENRTFDQILGDLGNGSNGDPTLTVFGRAITPNFHAIAKNFVTLDNFFDPGDASMNGWSWTTQAGATDQVEKAQQLNYAGRGLSYDTEGSMRNVGIGLPVDPVPGHPEIPYRKIDPTLSFGAGAGGPSNLLPGPANVARLDAAGAYQGGVLWQAVQRAGKSIRNYGFWTINNPSAPEIRYPYINLAPKGIPVAIPLDLGLAPSTDVFFRGFDQCYPDVWNVEEWQRDWATLATKPTLTLLRIDHDHTGCYDSVVGGFNTPETQQADNDLAVGRVVQTIANDPVLSKNTLIFVVEDDPQDGPDHVDSHRSTAYIVGPYVKHHAVVSTRYTTVNMIRTMEDILGVGYLNLNDALQRPMTDVFDLNQSAWTFTATASTVLKTTQTAIDQPGDKIEFAEGPDVTPTHDGAYWAKQTRGFDFSAADRAPTELYNRVLWEGLMGGRPFPAERSGKNLGGTAEAGLNTAPDARN